jgi:hypothetical protein
MSAGEDVHRIDLDLADPLDEPAEMTSVDATRWTRFGKALRGDRDSPGGRD